MTMLPILWNISANRKRIGKEVPLTKGAGSLVDITDKALTVDQTPPEAAQAASERRGNATWKLIKSDLDRYRTTDERSYLAMLIISPETLACIVYRWGYWVWHYTGPFQSLVRPQRILYILTNRIVEVISGITIRPRARIGKGLYVGHSGSVHIGAHVVMGENCNVQQEVTIGIAGRGDKRGSPTIGNRVFIGPGAKIFGPIVIGDDVAIGANAVVTKSLPDRAVAVGVPARIISYEGSFEFILYDGMEHDQQRLQSLEAREQYRANRKTKERRPRTD